MKLHREGNFLIPASLLILAIPVSLLFWLCNGTAFAFLAWAGLLAGCILFVLIVNFFRNPEFPIALNANQVLAPCDGKVVVIEEVDEPVFFKEKRIQVSIFMSPLNVHVNRNPIGGDVIFQKYFPGKYLMAFNPKSSTENEMNYVVISDGKRAIGFKQIAGFLARRVKWYINEGQKVKQGDEMGFIRFGSRIDLFLPVGTKIKVNLQDETLAARTVIAEL